MNNEIERILSFTLQVDNITRVSISKDFDFDECSSLSIIHPLEDKPVLDHFLMERKDIQNFIQMLTEYEANNDNWPIKEMGKI
jgi:hypothetical protein